MVEETCRDYAKFLQATNFKKEIEPIGLNIDEILTRMEEFESSLIIMKNLASLTSVPEIIQSQEDFEKQFIKIDNLQLVLNAINNDLSTLEQSVTKAEDELGFNNSGIKGFLKPWFGMSSKIDRMKTDDGARNESVLRPLTFKSSDYFDDSHDEHIKDEESEP